MKISSLQPASFRRVSARMTIATLVAVASGPSATAEPCNPVIDGTYCATQMPKRAKPKPAPRPSVNMPSIQNTARDASPNQDTPATWGGISFSNTGERCVGLMRRGKCK